MVQWITDAVFPLPEQGDDGQLHEYSGDLSVGEWKFIEDPGNPGHGHGYLKCPNEVSMNMAKLAFASAVRIKDADGVEKIPFIKETTNVASPHGAEEGSQYTHFFRLPTRFPL